MKNIRDVKKYLFERFQGLMAPLEQNYAKTTILQSLMLAKENRKKTNINKLSDVEFSGFSQWGEDGIIDWLIEKLPDIPKTFIEFGVEDYKESNTRMLLNLRNWRGYVMDGSSKNIANIKRQDISWRFDLTANCAFIDRENINQLINESGLSGDIGLLSVDIDGNDYWVWEAIDAVNPAIVVCEYNAVLGDLHRITVPYQKDFQRTQAHFSNLYFGASLPSLIELGRKKGYCFVGTNSNGINAFFIKQNYAPLVMNSIEKIISYPSLFREERNSSGHLTFTRGNKRADIISHLPVYDFETNSIRSISELSNLYSTKWTLDN